MKLESDRDTYATQVVNYNGQIAALEAPKYESWAKSFVIPGNIVEDENLTGEQLVKSSYLIASNINDVNLESNSTESAIDEYLKYLEAYEKGEVSEGVEEVRLEVFALFGARKQAWSILKNGVNWIIKPLIKETVVTNKEKIQNLIERGNLQGAKLNDKVEIPKNWIKDNTDGEGVLYLNNLNRKENIRIMKSGTNPNFSNYNKPYFRIKNQEGNFLDIEGNPTNSADLNHIIINKIEL